MKRGDLIKQGNRRYIVVTAEQGLELWDFEAWAEGYYDAYYEIGDEPFETTGNVKDNPELLPKVCDGYNGEPTNIECVGVIFRNPIFYPQYATPHPFEPSHGNIEVCVCGEDKWHINHKLPD